MPDPIQVEIAFQDLLIQLEASDSIRHRYRLLRDFLSSLKDDFKKYKTYIIQLSDEIPFYKEPVTWSGMNPEEIESDIELYEEISNELYIETFNEIVYHLKEICLLLYACLNEERKADLLVKDIFGTTLISKKSEENNSQSLLSNLGTKLTNIPKNSGKQSEKKEKSASGLLNQINRIRETQEGTALVPVVEINDYTDSRKGMYGRLRQLSVDLYGNAGNEDQLVQNFRVYGAEKPLFSEKKTVLIAARNLFETQKSARKSSYYKGGVNFELSSAIHDGDSANLAISAIWYTQLLRASAERERFVINSHVAFTGDVKSDGTVLPVDSDTIQLKARAVFFSWANVLVVPAMQSQAFENEILKLQKKYPNRKLYLIAIHQLKDVFFDRRVADHEIQGRLKYYVNRIRNEQSRAAFIPLIVVLLLIIARLVYGPVDRNPVIIEYEGSEIVLKNSAGSVVERIEVGEAIVDHQNARRNSTLSPLSLLIDINKDGINEVIFGTRVGNQHMEPPYIKAWSVSGDSLIWEQEINFTYEYPRQLNIFEEGFQIREIGSLNSNSNSKIIVNASSNLYFQAILTSLDSANGQIEKTYLHPGRIEDMILVDITNDGVDEVVFTGVNNAYWSAIAGMIQYDEIGGYAPATLDYIPSDAPPSEQSVYMKLPRTVVGKYYSPIDKYNMGLVVHYDSMSETLSFVVRDGIHTFEEYNRGLEVLYYFESTFEPAGIGTNDVFDVIARRLYEEGKIELNPDYNYFQSFKDSIQYWNGTEFVTSNQYFEEQ